MSRFLCPAVSGLDPYTPGEQPRDMRYIKLNTNESPFPPSPKVVEALNEEERQKLRLYSDPTCKDLVDAIAKRNDQNWQDDEVETLCNQLKGVLSQLKQE